MPAEVPILPSVVPESTMDALKSNPEESAGGGKVENVPGAVQKVADNVHRVSESVLQTAVDIAQKTKDVTDRAIEDGSDIVKKSTGAIVDVAHKTKDKTKDIATSIENATGRAIEDGAELISEQVHKTTQSAVKVRRKVIKLKKKAQKRLFNNSPILSALFGVFVIFIMVATAVVILLALELSERRNLDADALLEYEASVKAVRNSTCLNEAGLAEDFIAYLGEAPEVLSDMDYTFQYILFAFSIISTIGYGNISPLNEASQCFCVVYALVGIPVAGLLFTHTASTVFNATQDFFLQQANDVREIFRELDQDKNARLTHEEIQKALEKAGIGLTTEEFELAFQKAEANGDGHLDEEEFVKLVSKLNMRASYFQMSKIKSMSLAAIFFIWWLLGGIVFSAIEEDMDFFIALYFCMVTLTTVGLGDYYPVTYGGIIFNILFSIVGLGIIAMAISVISDVVSTKADMIKAAIDDKTTVTRKVADVNSKHPPKLAARETIFHQFVHSTVFHIFSLFFLCFIGGKIFYALEAENEIDNLKIEARLLEKLYRADNVTYVSVFGDHFEPVVLDDIEPSYWIEYQDWFFAFTVASTIGYGNHAPETVGGQIFLIFYAFLAIPITGLTLTVVSTRLVRRQSQFISGLVGAKTLVNFKLYDTDGSGNLNDKEVKEILEGIGIQAGDISMDQLIAQWDEDGDNEVSKEEFISGLEQFQKAIGEALLSKYNVVIAASTFLIWFFIGAIIVWELEEDWTFGTALYFCVITLTTVGFGDRVPSQKSSRTVVFLFASGGLGLLGILLNALGDFVNANVNNFMKDRIKKLNARINEASKCSSQISEKQCEREAEGTNNGVEAALKAPEPTAPGPLFPAPDISSGPGRE